MIPWITKLFTDESVFERLARSAILFLALLLPSVTGLPSWASAIGAALAIFIGAGQKNIPTYPLVSGEPMIAKVTEKK